MIKFIKNTYYTASSKLLKLILLFLASLLISACDQDLPPIEADDFGYPKVTVYAKGENVSGEEENQLSEWVPTGYKYNGDKIVIMVYNPAYSYGGSQPPLKYTWNSWLCEGESDICSSMYNSPACNFPQGYCHSPTDKYETIDNAPCYLSQGQGLYLLVTYPDGDVDDPNIYESINRLPSEADMYTKSLWDPPVSGAEMYNNGSAAYGFSGELEPNPTISTDSETKVTTEIPSDLSQSDYVGGRAYFKILDRYYGDNSGHQYAVMKRGFDSVVPPPIATVIEFVTETMDRMSESLYKEIVNNYDFRLSIKTLLVLYIIVHGVLFIGGASDMTQSELVSLFIKLVIVIQLLTGEDSWTLFNNYFFKFFTSGLDEMIGIVTSNIDQSDNGFTFFDTLLSLLFSYETSMKIQALVWSFPSGFLVTFIIYAGFALFTIAIAKAVMIYLLAYMAIALLIIVAPIFICFMLFNQTRPLFETWLNAFANYFLQAVLVMAALNLLGQIIVDQIYMILGFKACFEDNPSLTIGTWCFSKTWFICSDLSTGLVPTEVPGYGYNTTTTVNCDASSGFECQDTSVYCEPFECIDDRYPDLPFLDPEIEKEHDLIDNFKSPNSLSIPMLYESSVLLLMCYLMMKFNDVVPGLGKGLAKGGSAGRTALGATASSSMTDFKNTLSGMKNASLKLVTGKSELERGIARREKFNEVVNVVKRDVVRAVALTKATVTGFDKAASDVYKKSGKLKALFYPVKKVKQLAVLAAKSPVLVLKGGLIGASLLKDTILKPGNLMIGTPEEIAARNKAVKEAKAYNRAKDASEGKQVSLSYKEKLTKSIQDKTGITKFNQRVADFDEKYTKDGKLHLRSVGGAMRRGVGRALYNTRPGKAVYDGATRLKDSIKEEYRARFTEQGRIDRENARRKDNQIRALAEQYQKDAPERNRREKLDRLASEALEQHCKNLNLDKELLLGMSQEDQELYIKRAYAELPEHLRSSIAATTSFDMLKAHLENDRINRTITDTDPSILVNEAYDALDIDKGAFNSLDTKGKLAALEKGLRAADLTGPGAMDSYRAYRYLKEKAEAQLAQEKAAQKEQKRQQSFRYKAGQAIGGMKRGIGQMGRGMKGLGQGGVRRVQNGLSRISRIRARDITLRNVAVGTASVAYGAIKFATKPVRMTGRAIKRSFNEALDKRGVKIDFSMGFYRPATFSYTRKVASLEGKGTTREKQLLGYKQRYDKDKLKINYKNADRILQESCAVLGITKAAIDTMPPEKRKAYIEKEFNSTIDMDISRDFERYKAYRAAQAVVEHRAAQPEKTKLAKKHKKSVIEELNKKEVDRKQAIADARRAEQVGIAREQAEERKVLEQRRNKDTAQLCKALKMDYKEFVMMDKESQGRYLSRAYAELPQDKKDAKLNKLYREIRDDIASNGEITTAITRMNKGLAELGLSEARYNSLSPEDRLAALEKRFKESDLNVNGGEKYAAYQYFKRKAQIEVDNLAREEAAKGTFSYKATGAVIDAVDKASSVLTSVKNKAKGAKNYLGEQATKAGNTWDLLRGRSVRLEGKQTTVAKMADSHYAHAKRIVNDDNAGQLFTEACSTLNIDTTAFHSMSKERSLEYISERLDARAAEITKGKKIKENTDAFNTLADSTRAHANLKAIIEKGAKVEDPLASVQDQREKTISSYESQHRQDRHMQEVTGEGDSSNSLITRDVGVELGLNGAVLDLMTHKKIRTEAIGEKAAEVLGFSEEDAQTFLSSEQEKQLEMLNKAMREETMDLSRKEDGNADLSDDKHYLAYRTLKEIADKNVPASTNPFDDNYVDPAETAASSIIEETAPKKPSIFEKGEKDLKSRSKKDLFGDESGDDMLDSKDPKNK
ncbi:MAG: type IV secretion system protein [Rickettsiales bacterium]|jgi:type IV secretory pathway VirB6-like protein|nr:type IV secretion system protein [Rickettsiales bacterium]